MTTGGFVSECRSMVPSFLFPFYNRSAGNTRLPLKSLQNNYLQQRDLSSKSNNKQQVRTLSEIKAILNNNNLSDETDAANNKKDEVKLRKGHAEHGRKPPLPPGLSIESPLAPSRTTTVIQASTSELLRSLGHFLKIQCPLKCFDPSYLVWKTRIKT
jgi:hypothetical protein